MVLSAPGQIPLLPDLVFSPIVLRHVLAERKVDPLPGTDPPIDLSDGLWKEARHRLSRSTIFPWEETTLCAPYTDNVLGFLVGSVLVFVLVTGALSTFALKDINLQQRRTDKAVERIEMLVVFCVGKPHVFEKHQERRIFHQFP